MKNIIYKIVNDVNEKIYIGSAVKKSLRINQHMHHLKKGTHHNLPLQSFVNKYGIDKIHFIVIEKNIPIDKLINREQYYIDFYKDYNILFNIRMKAESMLGTKRTEEQIERMKAGRMANSGYNTGWKHTEEAKKKISEAHKGKIISKKQKSDHSLRMKGRKHTDEAKVKISKARKGIVFSDDHKLNLSISAKGNTNWKNVNYDNPERNKKISLAMKKRQSKPVINTETGERYNSAKDAAKAFGMAESTFSKHLSGYNKKNKTPFIYEV